MSTRMMLAALAASALLSAAPGHAQTTVYVVDLDRIAKATGQDQVLIDRMKREREEIERVLVEPAEEELVASADAYARAFIANPGHLPIGSETSDAGSRYITSIFWRDRLLDNTVKAHDARLKNIVSEALGDLVQDDSAIVLSTSGATAVERGVDITNQIIARLEAE